MSERSSTGDAACVLAVNAGSSSVRFALYDAAELLLRRARGKIERIGLPDTTLTVDDSIGARAQNRAIEASDHSSAASALIDWLDEADLLAAIKTVGHRVVHGGTRYSAPARVDDELLQELRRISTYSPEHRLRGPRFPRYSVGREQKRCGGIGHFSRCEPCSGPSDPYRRRSDDRAGRPTIPAECGERLHTVAPGKMISMERICR